jgi:hypothetical protein
VNGRAPGKRERSRSSGRVAAQRRIKVDSSLLDELHHRGGGEELGDRAGAKERARGGGHAAFFVRPAEALRPGNLIAVYQRDAQAGDVLAAHQLFDEPGEPRAGVRVVAALDYGGL